MKKALTILMVLCIGISVAMVGVACKKKPLAEDKKSTDATLSALSVSYDGTENGSLSPAFDKDTFAYTLEVGEDTGLITIAATKNNSKATIAPGGTGTHSVSAGTRTFFVKVTAENKAYEKVYSIVVTVPSGDENNATLKSLSVNSALVNGFQSGNKGPYSVTVRQNHPTSPTVSIGASPTVEDTRIQIKITSTRTGVVTNPGELVPVIVGINPKFVVRVTAIDEETWKEYELLITVLSVSGDATLETLTVTAGGVNYLEGFVAGNWSKEPYEVGVPKDVKQVTIGATLNENQIGKSVIRATDLGVRNLSTTSDRTTFIVRVTAEDGTHLDYTILVIVEPKDSEARLGSLGVIGGILSPAFDPDTDEYSVTMPATTKSFTVMAAKSGNNPTAKIVSGTGTYTGLVVGETRTVVVVVQAENGTFKIYTIHVTISSGTDTTLASLGVVGGTLSPAFSPAVETYSVTLPAGTKVVTINAAATEVSSKVYNILPERDDAKSTFTKKFNVSTGTVGIPIQVYSHAKTIKTYTINVTVEEGLTYDLNTVTSCNQNFYENDFNVNTTNYTVSFKSSGETKINSAIDWAMHNLGSVNDTVQAIKDAVMYDYEYTILPVFDGSPYQYEAGLEMAYDYLKEVKGYSEQLITLLKAINTDEKDELIIRDAAEAGLLIDEFFENIYEEELEEELIGGIIRESVLQRYLYYYFNPLSEEGWIEFTAEGADAGKGFIWGATDQVLITNDGMILIEELNIKLTFEFSE